MRILDARTKPVPDDLVENVSAGQGYRFITRGGIPLCDDGDDTYCRAAKFARAARNLNKKTVAWIGGGLCIGPRVFRIANCTQTVYEIEPALAEYCPQDCTFVPGDWRQTLTGTYDVIVYDLGDDVPYAELAPHLNPGGLVLPVASNPL